MTLDGPDSLRSKEILFHFPLPEIFGFQVTAEEDEEPFIPTLT